MARVAAERDLELFVGGFETVVIAVVWDRLFKTKERLVTVARIDDVGGLGGERLDELEDSCACVFRAKRPTYSEGRGPPIPIEGAHPFRGMRPTFFGELGHGPTGGEGDAG